MKILKHKYFVKFNSLHSINLIYILINKYYEKYIHYNCIIIIIKKDKSIRFECCKSILRVSLKWYVYLLIES